MLSDILPSFRYLFWIYLLISSLNYFNILSIFLDLVRTIFVIMNVFQLASPKIDWVNPTQDVFLLYGNEKYVLITR